jgi:hypothetical protein
MAHAQKPEFVFRRNRRVHLNRRGRQFSRLLAAEVCASTAVMLDTPCSEVVCRVVATHSIRQFPLHFPSRASPCAVIFQLDSNKGRCSTSPNEMCLARRQFKIRSSCTLDLLHPYFSLLEYRTLMNGKEIIYYNFSEFSFYSEKRKCLRSLYVTKIKR